MVVASGLLVVVACDRDAGPPAEAVTVRDSSGVEIVENGRVPADAPLLVLGDPPLLELGTVEDDGPEQFFRVSGLETRADGALAVVNGGTQEIRFFGPDGAHLGSVGREGEGPGEFRGPAGLWRTRGDSLVVWDGRNRRISVLAPSGEVVRTAAPERQAANPRVLTVFADGSWVLTDGRFRIEPGFNLMYTTFVRYDPEGRVVDSLPRQPMAVMGELGEELMIGSPLFAPRTTSSGDGSGYWVGTAEEYEVWRYDLSGSLVRVVRWAGPDRTVEPGAAERVLAERLEDADEDGRTRTRALHEARPVEDVYPAYETIAATDEGGVWVQRYEPPHHEDEGPREWLVFRPDGEVRGRIRVPRSLRILRIRGDSVFGIHRDELGVEHVRIQTLRFSSDGET